MHLGFLPEIPPLYQDMTVDEYLLLVAYLHRTSKQRAQAELDNVKQRCGLDAQGRYVIGTLSKGFQQRVGIAQAIIHNPDVVSDEPTVGLDPNQMREDGGVDPGNWAYPVELSYQRIYYPRLRVYVTGCR